MENVSLPYVNRENGCIEYEVIYGEKELTLLYSSNIGRFLRKAFITSRWFSHLNAIPKRASWSQKKIPTFIETFDIDTTETEQPVASYQSLDEFFTRKLKPGARPICPDEKALSSPADGRVLSYKITENLKLHIKGNDISVAKLLKNRRDAKNLEGGTAFVIRLAPKDYHRFHFPCDAEVCEQRSVGGKLESVHPIALNAGANSFLNRRDISHLCSSVFGDLYMVDVGALTIGTIVQTNKMQHVSKGQEKGFFRFGGSTVVLLWGKEGPRVDEDILNNSEKGIETLVKCGTRIASL